MRLAGLLLLTALAASVQFKSTVPLVVSPVTVTDSTRQFINGLTVADLVVYDNSVPQKVQLQVVEDSVASFKSLTPLSFREDFETRAFVANFEFGKECEYGG